MIFGMDIKRISEEGKYFFFGYYDLQPFNQNGTLHLAHRTDFMDRLQREGDTAEVGVIETDTLKYTPIERTEAWNFQQGAMLQWNPLCEDEIIYNVLSDGEYVTCFENIKNGKKRYADRSIANVSKDGKYGLSINMSRLYDFRPGYGYATVKDKFYNDSHSKDDGIFLVDMQSGKSKLILSLDEIWDFSGRFFKGEDKKLVVKHITFNPSANRFLFLVRDVPVNGKPKHDTAVITANRDGSDMYMLSDYCVASHYNWKDDDTLMIYAWMKELECCRSVFNYELHDKTHEGRTVGGELFASDNHMSYSPDKKTLLWDGYPDKVTGKRPLGIMDMESEEVRMIGDFYSMPSDCIDIRCDLHPRWNRDGSLITFDSTHEGYRGIYMLKTDQILK